jgi:hypothetical protein
MHSAHLKTVMWLWNRQGQPHTNADRAVTWHRRGRRRVLRPSVTAESKRKAVQTRGATTSAAIGLRFAVWHVLALRARWTVV